MSKDSPYQDQLIPLDPEMKELIDHLRNMDPSSVIVLCDSNTQKHCYPILEAVLERSSIAHELIKIQAGEEHKTLDTAVKIWDQMNQLGVDRNAALINLGGGMICDLGAFAASLYKRGIDFIHMPTSLLAIVDASLGGKNGVDHNSFKNLIGTFNAAEAIFIHFLFLKTLPEPELISGMAEVYKHALIRDEWLWQEMKSVKPQDINLELILKAAEIKRSVVEKDPIEKGERKLLNFGHSVGHGIESFFLGRSAPIQHGMAIAAGMICESYISFQRSMINKQEFEDIIEVLGSNYVKLEIEESAFGEIVNYIRNDKKNRQKQFMFVLLEGIGKAQYDQTIKEEEILAGLKYYRNEL